MDSEVKVFFHSASPNATGFYVVVSDMRDRQLATCISFENGMKEEEAVVRVRQAFASLARAVEKAA
jgi:hypothetical protein